MRWQVAAVLLLLIIAGGVLRAWPVASAPLWYDEADTWTAAVIDPAASRWSAETGLLETAPMPYERFFQWRNHFETAPLTFLLVRISTDLFGTDVPWAMRMPSLIAGILCIPAAFLLGHVVRGSALGLLAAALAAFDPSMVDQSQQARMYSVTSLLLLLTLALAITLVRQPTACASARPISANDQPNPHALPSDRLLSPLWRWLTLGLLLGLLLCSTQFTVAVWVGLAVGIVGLLALGAITRRPHPQAVTVLCGLTAAYLIGIMLANVGIYAILHRVLHGGPGEGAGLTTMQIAREVAVAAKDLINLTPAGLIIYPLAAVGLVLLARQCKTSTAILAGVALVNLLILFPFRRMHHFMDARYLACLQPALFIGLGMFALGLSRRPLRHAALAVVLLYIAIQAWQSANLHHYWMQPDRYLYAKAMIAVRDRMQPGETAAMYPGVGAILGHYYRVPQDPALFEGFYSRADNQPRKDVPPQVPADLEAGAVWLVIGMYNYETPDGEQYRKRADTLGRIAAHYGVTVDDAALQQHLKQERVVTARISKEGVTLESIGVE